MIPRLASKHTLRLFTVAVLALGACSDDAGHEGGGEGVPAVPTGLGAEELDGGAHLTWTDNSDDETQFMVMRMADGGEYETIASPPFDTSQYHDAGLESGTTYTYMVMAMNDAGASEGSNEVEFTAP